MKIAERISKLRELMKARGIDVYIEPTADPHQSEYVAECFRGREFISGFTGSAGVLVVSEKHAILWTDGRYFIQAAIELKDTGIELYKMGLPEVPTFSEWIANSFNENVKIGFNGKIFSVENKKKLDKALDNLNAKYYFEEDLVGLIWADRPDLPQGKVFELSTKYSGKSFKEKLKEVREHLIKDKADYLILSSLDDIAWLFNIRGNDVENNPVVFSYALISKEKAMLFVDEKKLSNEIKNSLEAQGAELLAYDDIDKEVSKLEASSTVLLDETRTSVWLYSKILAKKKAQTDYTTVLKAVKNDIEIENLKIAYIKDGVALTKFFKFLEENIEHEEITEYSAGVKLLELRQEQADFIEPSFSTIAGYKENGAMMHYSAKKDASKTLKKEGLFLVDSGGQYLNGTTDITRTITLGKTTNDEKRDATLALKGHINLIRAKFLRGTTGHVLDGFCRMPMWNEGIDYKSGTGHGIGFLLNVHEGPHRISSHPNDVALKPGMIVTIEPGVYREGQYGIRIENVVVVKEAMTTDSGEFYKFEALSMCYIDLNLVDKELLSKEEITWLNEYHKNVYESLKKHLSVEEANWLKEKTKSI